MPHHNETRFLPYRPDQLFELVIAIDQYPRFLPWCKAVRITEKTPTSVTADLMIGYKMFSEKFSSHVTFHRPQSIAVKYLSGPLSRLSNEWHFKEAPGGCDLSFYVEFDFRSPLMRSVMQMFFDKALKKMVAAFEARADELYGRQTSSS